MEQLMDVRIALEGATAADMARKGTAEQITELKTLLKGMAKAVDDPKSFAKLDMAFHIHLAACSGNPLLYDLISAIRNQLSLGMETFLLTPQARPHSLKEHTAIFKRIHTRDAQGARAAMQLHLEAAFRRYVQQAID
ncbi:MAG TPA: FCD domain-containing protein [Acidobacteriaceae bacterium]|nr:FCD domain-containing protein [Acidobacteriaceae bacterium]